MGTQDNLAQELEEVSKLSLAWLRTMLEQPIDEENAALLRAQAAAAGISLNTQLRADTLRLQAQRSDKALENLLILLREKEKVVPATVADATNRDEQKQIVSVVT